MTIENRRRNFIAQTRARSRSSKFYSLAPPSSTHAQSHVHAHDAKMAITMFCCRGNAMYTPVRPFIRRRVRADILLAADSWENYFTTVQRRGESFGVKRRGGDETAKWSHERHRVDACGWTTSSHAPCMYDKQPPFDVRLRRPCERVACLSGSFSHVLIVENKLVGITYEDGTRRFHYAPFRMSDNWPIHRQDVAQCMKAIIIIKLILLPFSHFIGWYYIHHDQCQTFVAFCITSNND